MALRICYSGADNTGDYQANPNASLGGHRSSVCMNRLAARRVSDIPGLSVVEVAGYNGTGIGRLRADTNGNVAWTPPGGTEGTAQAIVEGETVRLVGGSSVSKWIDVARVSSDVPAGSEAISLVEIYNNLWDDISSDEAVAGVVDYRALFIYNDYSSTITSVSFWFPASSGISIAAETPSSGEIQTIADDVTAPTGLSWSTPTQASPFTVSTLAAGASVGIWLRRTVAADTDASGRVTKTMNMLINGPDTARLENAYWRYRIARDDAIATGLWVGEDEAPDYSAEPEETWTSKPHTTTYTLSAGHTYQLATRNRNAYGLWGAASAITKVRTGSGGEDSPVRPSDASGLEITPSGDGNGMLGGIYYPAPDEANRADGWVAWCTEDGGAPDDTDDPSVYQAMGYNRGIEQLHTQWESESVEGATLKALIRTRRIVAGTGTVQASDVAQLSASGAGSITTSDSFADWDATGGAVIRGANGEIREIVLYSSRTDYTLTIDAADRAQMWTSEDLGADSDTITPLDWVDSINETAVSCVATHGLPTAPLGCLFFGRESAIAQGISVSIEEPESGDRFWWIDEPNNIYIDCTRDGWAYFYADTQLVWAAYYLTSDYAGSRFYIPSEMSMIENGASMSDTGVAYPVEVVAWNGTKTLGLCAKYGAIYYRGIPIDITGQSITVGEFRESDSSVTVIPQSLYSMVELLSTLCLWDASSGSWVNYLQFAISGIFTTRCKNIVNTLSQAEIEAL